ncbi:MAG: hypothetical protein OXG15_12640 [Gammaproteobacteria bacterium]|nr:hypothetical protein [Gammaproteobacteria bacterium]
MREIAEIRIRHNGTIKRETIQTEIIPIDRQLAVFAYNNHLYYAGKVETKDGYNDYYTAEIDKEI